jgi:hypothetical protein
LIKTFILKLLLIILPIAFLVSASNYFIDPANIFSSKEYTGGIAAILSEGHNVDNISNYNERLLEEQIIIRLKQTPDIVVLGSSRIMEVGSDFFPEKKVLNCGVSHANINDLVALTGLLDSLGRLPHEMLINVDVGLISKKSTVEWQSLSVYHDYFLRKIPAGDNLFNESEGSNEFKKLYSLISFDYFKESLSFITSGSTKKYYDISQQKPVLHGRFSDGTICYSAKYLYPDTVKVAHDAAITAFKEGLSGPDTIKITLLNSLIDFLQAKKIKIEFVMLPYHFAYYDVVNVNQQNLFHNYESLFCNIAKQKNIHITGSFDARKFGLNQSHFYDMYHCSKQAIQKIITN